MRVWEWLYSYLSKFSSVGWVAGVPCLSRTPQPISLLPRLYTFTVGHCFVYDRGPESLISRTVFFPYWIISVIFKNWRRELYPLDIFSDVLINLAPFFESSFAEQPIEIRTPALPICLYWNNFPAYGHSGHSHWLYVIVGISHLALR